MGASTQRLPLDYSIARVSRSVAAMDWQFIGRTTELASTVDRLLAGESMLLTGPAGVGKSRLAEEAEEALRRSHHVERLIGSPSVQQLPFGAVAHLGGDAPLPDATVLISFITKALRKRAKQRPAALVVDDINQLDDGSIAFIQQLLAHETIPVLATARSEGASDPRIVPLWKDGLITRQELEPLSRAETEMLTERVAGGPCTTELKNEVWRLTEGFPLFVREVVLEGAHQGAIANRDGIWGLERSLGRSQRVADIVQVRTAHLLDEEIEGLRVVALCEPMPLQLARRMADPAVLESLEKNRMVRVDQSPTGPVLRSSHPLIAEVTADQMPQLTKATLTTRLAHVLLDTPGASANDAMRASIWLLDAGEVPPQAAAIRGARAALRGFDPELGLRLATAALQHGRSQEATVLVGRSHAASGEAAQAVSTLQDAQSQAETDRQTAAATSALAEVHMFNLGDAPRAVREIEKALETMTDPGARAELNSQLMLAVGITGDFDLGHRIGPEVADNFDLPPPAQLTSVMAMTLTQSMTGKLDGVFDRVDRGIALADQFSDLHPFAPDQVGMNRVMALQAVGDFAGADEYGQQRIRAGVGLPGPWLFVTSVGRQFTGDIEEGRRLAKESEAYFEGIDPLGIEPMAHGIRGLFEAIAGNTEEAAALITAVRSDPRGEPTRAAVWADRAESWNRAQGGDVAAAAQLALAVVSVGP